PLDFGPQPSSAMRTSPRRMRASVQSQPPAFQRKLRVAIAPAARFWCDSPLMPPKTSCPVSLTQFLEKAEPLKVVINGQEMLAEVKQFSTGSFGWYMNGKTVVS